MKACSSCGRLYPDDAGFCPVDGQQLVSATQVPVKPDHQDARIGQVICDHYQVRRVVADGGMGRVYEALDMVMRRSVALKILHAEVANDAVAIERFKREFEVSKALPHDHIVDVLDFRPTGDGTFAMVMEFLYGEELRATLKREKVIAPGRVVRILSQVAVGLDEAHARNFVHRDLKPDNVFLCQTSDGDIVKLLDFGSAKDKGESAKKLTMLGTTIGSPFYMAPEQAQGLDTLDHRADVWALAAIVYEAVVGRVPFLGNNGPSILLEILTKEPKPPSEAAKGQKYAVPPTLDRVMVHAFKKSAALRIGSVGALADTVGAAYGLAGGHAEWAKTREIDLQAQIDARMPELLLTRSPVQAPNVADNFFGESSSLEQMADPFAAAQPKPGPSAPPPSTSADDLALAGIPKTHPNLGLFIAVGGGALLLGVVIAVVLVVLR
jgi:serine/threonine protein kinase